MPEYESCLLKRNEETNDDEIFEKVKAEGINYYRYYTIMDGEEEKVEFAEYYGEYQQKCKMLEKQYMELLGESEF